MVAQSSAPGGTNDGHPVRGVLFCLVGTGLLTLVDAMLKLVLENVPLFQVATVRSLVAFAPLIFLARKEGTLKSIVWRNRMGQLYAAVLWTVFIQCFTFSLIYLPLSTAVVILYTNPLFVVLLQPMFAGSGIQLRRIASVAVGFTGILFIIQPGTAGFSWVTLVALASALGLSIRDLHMRKLLQTDSPIAIAVISNFFVMVSSLLAAAFTWSSIAPFDLAMLVTTGLIAGFATFFMTSAFSFLDAQTVSVLRFSGVIWAVFLGAALWNETPDFLQYFGMVLVFVNLYFTIRRGMQVS